MKRESWRSLGAIAGLSIGWIVMWQAGWRGLTPAFIFGIIGTLTGSLTAERLYDRRHQAGAGNPVANSNKRKRKRA